MSDNEYPDAKFVYITIFSKYNEACNFFPKKEYQSMCVCILFYNTHDAITCIHTQIEKDNIYNIQHNVTGDFVYVTFKES